MKIHKPLSTLLVLKWMYQIIAVVCFILVFSEKSYALNQPVILVLFKGDVFLLDKDKQKQQAKIGQQIHADTFPWIENGKRSTIFLQSGKKLVRLKNEGVFSFKELFNSKASVLQRSLSFLKNLSAPRSYVSQTRVRGDLQIENQNDEAFFESIWKQLVLNDSETDSSLSDQDLLAAAAWFQQREKPARVAYILERLNMTSQEKNDFYHQLRMESLQHVSLTDINQEVEATRLAASIQYSPGKHKALLIGINSYNEATWQSLQTPIRDVKELKRLLVKDYLFEDDDILLLENAKYEEIISAFNKIKQVSDEETNLLIYYAGHGFYPPGEDEGYWVPKDGGKPETLKLFIPTSTVLSKIKSIKSRHTLVIADSCFSGSLIRATRGAEIHSRFFRDLSTKKSRQIITSGGLEPVADQGWGDNSVFAGKLLDILGRQRKEPLSASELALNLRKEVKEADAFQTPEYGRLYVADDQNGEFFFVRRDQDLSDTMVASEEFYPDRGLEQSASPDDSVFNFEEPDKEGIWLKFGVGFHMAVLNYKFTYEDSAGNDKTETDSTTLSGVAAHLGLGYKKKKTTYELVGNMGQISSSSFECDEEDKDTEFCKTYAESSVSGSFTSLGVLAKYSVLPPFFLDVELGGGFFYEQYSFNKLLDERNLDASFVSACFQAEFGYYTDEWFIGERNEFCFRVNQMGGSLPDFENSSLSDLQIPFTMKISISTGIKF